jgi:hypothetical protein
MERDCVWDNGSTDFKMIRYLNNNCTLWKNTLVCVLKTHTAARNIRLLASHFNREALQQGGMPILTDAAT